jgi:hypothetical protein
MTKINCETLTTPQSSTRDGVDVADRVRGIDDDDRVDDDVCVVRATRGWFTTATAT